MTARLAPIPATEWSDEMRNATRRLLPPPAHRQPSGSNRPRPVGVLETFAHHPALAEAFFGFNRHVLWGTSLSRRRRHVLIVRVAVRRRCVFLWNEHVHQARDAGLTEDELAMLTVEPDAPLRDPLDAALSRAADEFIDDGAVAEPTWSTLAEHLSAAELLDVVFTIGCYVTVAGFMRSVDLDVTSDRLPHPDGAAARTRGRTGPNGP